MSDEGTVSDTACAGPRAGPRAGPMDEAESVESAGEADGSGSTGSTPGSRPAAIGSPSCAPRDALFYLASGRYAVERLLGEGSGGEVFAAHDTLLDRPVAIKRLPVATPGSLAKGTSHDDQERDQGGEAFVTSEAEAAARLLVEARAVARLSHPNIVTCYDVFEEDDQLHLVLEQVPGPTLRQRLDQDGPLNLESLARLGVQLAAALAHAHANGIVHRDLKPENILLAPGGPSGEIAKLTDFGIARASGTVRLTMPGMVLGTPAYVAPEQAIGNPIDGRADLYGLGCVLYEAATGVPPFEADTPLLVVSQHLHATPAPPSIRRPDLPPVWDALILCLLAKQPQDRFSSATALQAALEVLSVTAGNSLSPVAQPVPAAVTPPGNTPATPDGKHPEANHLNRKKPRILAVDEDRTLVQLLEFVLREANYEPAVADDGMAAWEQFLVQPPDLVVLDIHLKGLDGLSLLRKIRASPGPEASTPVVVLASSADDAISVSALDAGADDFIAKPFSPDQLLARIRAALRRAPGRATS